VSRVSFANVSARINRLTQRLPSLADRVRAMSDEELEAGLRQLRAKMQVADDPELVARVDRALESYKPR
jgi:hypothetical protein